MKILAAVEGAAGVLSVLFFALLVASGWGLMAGYVPSAAEAFDSLLYWRQAGGWGAFLRSLHVHLASGLVLAGFLHLLARFLRGAHAARPRGWWLAASLYLLILGLCFTGFLLPMDQKAYWGTIVRLGIIETAPLVGPPAADLLRGGPALNAATLPRFYALHAAVLPAAAGLLLAWLLRPVLRTGRQRWLPWLGFALAGTVAAYLLAAAVPAPLELPADPADSDYVARPEWYFLWLFQFGKYVTAVPWVESLILPVVGLGLLFALPYLPLRRRGRALLATTWCAAWLLLTALALYEDRDLPPKLDYERAIVARAADHYQEHCYDCHGLNGHGDGPQSRAFDLEVPDFAAAAFWREHDRDEMRAAIRDGKGEDMPAFGDKLEPVAIDALITFLETSFRPQEGG